MKRLSPKLGRRGSVLLIVLVTLVFTAFALTIFIEKAGTDLLAEIREADAGRLRSEAYSALETTLGVLEDFRIVGNGLHSPAEGWSDPLGFAEYQPMQAGRTVEVTLEDESAKLPLTSVKPELLIDLLKYWQVSQTDAERLTDALMGWIKKDYVPTSAGAPRIEDYEATPLPFDPPGRSLRFFSELLAIEGVRQAFFDENGLPNDLYRHFTETFSLYRYNQPNINGNRLEPLLAQNIYDDEQQRRVTEYLTGAGSYQTQGPGFFKSARMIAAVAGGQPSKLGYGTTVQALRIHVTVREGQSSFVLTAVVAPQGGAKVVPPSNVKSTTTTTTDKSGVTTTTTTDSAAQPTQNQSSSPTTAVPTPVKLNYPFTFLEIRENDIPVTIPASNPTTDS